ncbi:tRNA (adenine-N(1))-methyltransferase, partial [Pseudomonas sp. FG1]|nr:tRNA (adenine-N(1))-methyltransferase [Pseudomonas sp. FG1]
TYTAEQLYFGPLQMQARSPAFVAKWQRMLRQKRKTLASLEQARQAVPEQKVQEIVQQLKWIDQLLA